VAGPTRFDSPPGLHYDARLVTAKRQTRPATALLVLAFAALIVSVLHGAVPHHSLPGPCHDCEALSAPADLSPDTVVVATTSPDRPAPLRAEARVVEPPARWLGPPRAPPSALAA
jgi:hypothetical protein